MKWNIGNINGVIFKPFDKHIDQRGSLMEIFRSDEIDSDIMPQMGYISITHSNITRGPHEHKNQTDMFGFIGPGNFKLKLWDYRYKSSTYGNMISCVVGIDNPMRVIVPPGVVHGYINISNVDGYVLNFPNKLYAGKRKKEPVDEIRHENSEFKEFVID